MFLQFIVIRTYFLAKNYMGRPFCVRINLGKHFGRNCASGKAKPLRQMLTLVVDMVAQWFSYGPDAFKLIEVPTLLPLAMLFS